MVPVQARWKGSFLKEFFEVISKEFVLYIFRFSLDTIEISQINYDLFSFADCDPFRPKFLLSKHCSMNRLLERRWRNVEEKVFKAPKTFICF